jgi:hypothetical protein
LIHSLHSGRSLLQWHLSWDSCPGHTI